MRLGVGIRSAPRRSCRYSDSVFSRLASLLLSLLLGVSVDGAGSSLVLLAGGDVENDAVE